MTNFVFDIETVPVDTDRLQELLPVFDPELVKVGNTIDPEKIAAKIEKERAKHLQRFYRAAALSAVSGQLAMIGLMGPDKKPVILEGTEADIIRTFFEIFETEKAGHWIGFNIKNFDVPFLYRRAWLHRIRIPYGIVRGRYLTDLFTDLLELWNGCQCSNPWEISLDGLGTFFGVGKKTNGGAEFYEVLRYAPEQARAYLLNDLELTWNVAEAMSAMRYPLRVEKRLETDPGTIADPSGPEPDRHLSLEPIRFY